MNKKHIATFCLALLVTATTIAQAGGPKGKGGWVPGATIFDYLRVTTSSMTIGASGGAYQRAGQVLQVQGKVGGVGDATILMDNSWEWDADSVADGSEIYDGTFHPCALNDIAPREMISSPAPFTSFDSYTYQQVVTITDNKTGDLIVGHVSGGSVCEVEIVTGGSINEWLIGLTIDGSENSGRFAGKDGRGYIVFRLNGVTAEFVGPFNISLSLD